MKPSGWLWIVALVLTVASARWQRLTGPTHELPGDVELDGARVHYVLQRTHKGLGDQPVAIAAPAGVAGITEWMAYGSKGPWTAVPMRREADRLVAALPHQAPGERLWYRVRLSRGAGSALLPAERPAAIRFTGAVPIGVLVPHIFFMFLAMLLSSRAGLEILRREARPRALAYATLAALFVGGMVLGPFVTHYAFGPWWTGFPVGSDITDSKTLIALAAWIAAALAVGPTRTGRVWVGLAALVTLVIFAIPHSWTRPEPRHLQLDGAGAKVEAPSGAPIPAPGSDTTQPPGR
jgi:hypothetical protein